MGTHGQGEGPGVIDVGSATRVAPTKSVNEDSTLTHPNLAAVADGMGGHAHGEVASALTVERLAALAAAGPVTTDALRQAIEQVNEHLLAHTAAEPATRGMGTTLVAVAPVPVAGSAHWLLAHIGDSRAYRLRGTDLELLTEDHSEVAELVAAGAISAESARTHPLRHVITQSLGSDPAPLPDFRVVPADAGERLLLCSDGVHDVLDDAALAALLGAGTSAEAAAAVVEAAAAAGTRDDATAVVLTLTATDPVPAGTTAPRSRLLEAGS